MTTGGPGSSWKTSVPHPILDGRCRRNAQHLGSDSGGDVALTEEVEGSSDLSLIVSRQRLSTKPLEEFKQLAQSVRPVLAVEERCRHVASKPPKPKLVKDLQDLAH